MRELEDRIERRLDRQEEATKDLDHCLRRLEDGFVSRYETVLAIEVSNAQLMRRVKSGELTFDEALAEIDRIHFGERSSEADSQVQDPEGENSD